MVRVLSGHAKNGISVFNVKRAIKKIVERSGYTISQRRNWELLGVSREEVEIIERARDFTMVPTEGILANIDSIDYVVTNGIEGAIVECGVWRGGSIYAMIQKLLAMGDQSRDIYLFDTFEGLPKPGTNDGVEALSIHSRSQGTETGSEWCKARISDVENLLASTGYDREKIHLIVGDVALSLPETSIDQIAVLRLDTDWYESTKIELEALYESVSLYGVLIIDDYGRWPGCRKAVDEFFHARQFKPLMTRVNESIRIMQKDARAL